MNQQLNELLSFTVEEFQENFDTLMERVESGESFIIRSDTGNVVIVPYNEVIDIELDELVKIHTCHCDAS